MFTTNRVGWMVLGFVCVAIPAAWAAPVGGPEEGDRAASWDRPALQERIERIIDQRIDQRIREFVERFRPEMERRIENFRDQVLPRMIEEKGRERDGQSFAGRGPIRRGFDRGIDRPGRDGRGFGPPWLREGRGKGPMAGRGRFGGEGRGWAFRGPATGRELPGIDRPMRMRERLQHRMGRELSDRWECPMMGSMGKDRPGRGLGFGREFGAGRGLGLGREAGPGMLRERLRERVMAHRGVDQLDRPAKGAEGRPQAGRPADKERPAVRDKEDADRPVQPGQGRGPGAGFGRGQGFGGGMGFGPGMGFGRGLGRGGAEGAKPEAGAVEKPVKPEASVERGAGRGRGNPEGRPGADAARVRPNANPLFYVFDANQDGEIQPQELKHFGELLKKAVNENGDKPIKVDEWNRILRQIARESRGDGDRKPPKEPKEQ